MELVIQSNGATIDRGAELYISHSEGLINLIVSCKDKNQYDFDIDLSDWEAMKDYIDSSIKRFQESEGIVFNVHKGNCESGPAYTTEPVPELGSINSNKQKEHPSYSERRDIHEKAYQLGQESKPNQENTEILSDELEEEINHNNEMIGIYNNWKALKKELSSKIENNQIYPRGIISEMSDLLRSIDKPKIS